MVFSISFEFFFLWFNLYIWQEEIKMGFSIFHFSSLYFKEEDGIENVLARNI
jgi:hypothetical protein